MTTAQRVRAVVTNDDGIGSAGLQTLARAAVLAGWDVVVAAPDHQASGTGAAITAVRTDGRIMAEPHSLPGLDGVPAYAIQAAPGFIALAALRGAFGPRPDYLLAGINIGPNTGRVLLHSGTVGAAMTAATHSVRAAAFSLDVTEDEERMEWDGALDVAGQILPALRDIKPGVILNVNIPNLPAAQIRGIRQAHLAAAGAVELSVGAVTGGSFQVTLTETGVPPAPGTDSALLTAGYAAVTPVQPISEATSVGLPWPAVRES